VRALGNLLAGVVALAVVGAGWLSLDRDPSLATHDFGSDPGPALVPRLLLTALGVGGVVLVVQGAWSLARRSAAAGPALGPRRLLWPAAFVASLLVYRQVLAAAGYPAATLGFCAAWMLVLTRRYQGRLTARSAALSVAAAVAITGAIYYVFKGFVRVPLP
jgi:Tripartite tricarboxylate transporter TctB family